MWRSDDIRATAAELPLSGDRIRYEARATYAARPLWSGCFDNEGYQEPRASVLDTCTCVLTPGQSDVIDTRHVTEPSELIYAFDRVCISSRQLRNPIHASDCIAH